MLIFRHVCVGLLGHGYLAANQPTPWRQPKTCCCCCRRKDPEVGQQPWYLPGSQAARHPTNSFSLWECQPHQRLIGSAGLVKTTWTNKATRGNSPIGVCWGCSGMSSSPFPGASLPVKHKATLLTPARRPFSQRFPTSGPRFGSFVFDPLRVSSSVGAIFVSCVAHALVSKSSLLLQGVRLSLFYSWSRSTSSSSSSPFFGTIRNRLI